VSAKIIMDSLTAVVLTRDEAANIGRCLEGLRWVPRVLVVDSFSTDATTSIAKSFRNVEVTQREFDSFAGQCNHALQIIDTEWVLSLDADYVVTDDLHREMSGLPTSDIAGYRVPFTYCIHGRPLRGTLYPARTVLYRKSAARYEDFGHGHKVKIAGKIQDLTGRMLHDDRKPLSRWLQNQVRYANQEADYLEKAADSELSSIDKLRRAIVPAPLAVGFYVMLVKRCILDGWPGWHYTMQRILAEVLISLELVDRKLGRASARLS
jgi:glycosyltransferase involved in cell wall biosynthesis